MTGGRSPRPEPSTGLPSYELTLCDATETPSVRARALLRGLSQAAACGPGQPTAHERSGSSARRPQPPSFAPAASASVWPPPRVPTSLCWALGVPRPLPEDRPGDDWGDGGAAPPWPCAGVRSRARSHHLLCGSPVTAQGTGGAGVRTGQPSPRGCVGPCDGVSPLSLLCVPSGGKGTLTALGPAALSKARRRQARSRVKPAHHPWIGRCCSSHLYKKRGAEPWPPRPRSGPIQSLPRLRSPEKGTPERERVQGLGQRGGGGGTPAVPEGPGLQPR